jgi:hypothetical protein
MARTKAPDTSKRGASAPINPSQLRIRDLFDEADIAQFARYAGITSEQVLREMDLDNFGYRVVSCLHCRLIRATLTGSVA